MLNGNDSSRGPVNTCNTETSALESLWAPRAGEIMQSGVVSIAQDESAYTAIGLLVERHLSGLPVVNDDQLAGIISEKDLLGVLYESEQVTGKVSDYMTKEVVCFDIEDSLDDIASALINCDFRRVAILRKGELCGVLSRSDLIQDYVESHKLFSWEGKCNTLDNAPQAKDVMQYGLLTVERQTSLYEAARILYPKRLTGLPVVDHGMHLVGIVSEKDILGALYGSHAPECLVNDIMTEEVVSFTHTDSIFDICHCLINHEFRRVPILNHGRLVGIVSRADIMMYIMKNRSTVSRDTA